MADLREDIQRLLDSGPDKEEALKEILAIDQAKSTWTFQDISVGPGTFGEIVDSSIVEKADGEYRVSDPETLRAVLQGEDDAGQHSLKDSIDHISVTHLTAGIRNRSSTLLAVAATLVFLFLMRILMYPRVMRENHVLSPEQDPYYYRLEMREALARTTEWYSPSAILEVGAGGSRPITYVSNWWLAAVLGGDQAAADFVTAWLPVVASIFVGVTIYYTAKTLTDDVRVGLASVFLFALVPIQAVYTGIGFLEHRLHQYVWLSVTLLALTWLASDIHRRQETHDAATAIRRHLRATRTWIASLGFATGYAFSILAWGGSIIMTFPLVAYVCLRAVLDAREDRPPVLANLPLIVGVSLGTALIVALNQGWNWSSDWVAPITVLVLVGTVGVFVLAEAFRYTGTPAVGLLGLQIGTILAGILGIRRYLPDVWNSLMGRYDSLVGRRGQYTEAGGLFGDVMGGIWGPIAQIGVDFLLAMAILAFAWYKLAQEDHPAWLVVTSYATVWFGLALVQVRFAAQLSIPLVVLAGAGLVWLLAWVDLARPVSLLDIQSRTRATTDEDHEEPIKIPEDRTKIAYLALILLLVCGMSLIFLPSLAAEPTYDDDQYASLVAFEEHAAEHDVEDPWVLSNRWHNRMYNYFLVNDSEGWSERGYQNLITSENPDEATTSDRYLVVHEIDIEIDADIGQTILHENLGPETESVPGLAHYRALHLGETASAYAMVDGAEIVLNGTTTNTTTGTTVEVKGQSYVYERPVTQIDNHSIKTTVAYPGEYEIHDKIVTVTEQDVLNGTRIEIRTDE